MSHSITRLLLAASAALTLALTGCVPAGSGTLTVVINGEEGAEEGFPATEFADGWAVSFDRYLVSVGEVVLTSNGEEVARVVQAPKVVDLHRGPAQYATLEDVPAGRLGLNFAIVAPTADAIAGEGVGAADLAEMQQQGLTYLLQGTAIKAPYAPVTFRLAFAAPVSLEDCTNGVDGTQGVVIPASAATEAELTLHVEHLFFDRLGTHTGVNLRFEAIAAMADDDGVVTLDALANQSVLNPVGLDGAPLTDDDGTPVIYDPGASSVQTLDQFLLRSLRDQPHFNGGGLCTLVSP